MFYVIMYGEFYFQKIYIVIILKIIVVLINILPTRTNGILSTYYFKKHIYVFKIIKNVMNLSTQLLMFFFLYSKLNTYMCNISVISGLSEYYLTTHSQ